MKVVFGYRSYRIHLPGPERPGGGSHRPAAKATHLLKDRPPFRPYFLLTLHWFLVLTLDRHQPLHFIGVGGIGMSALAAILARRGYAVSGSDPRDTPVIRQLRKAGVRVFADQGAATIEAIRAPDQSHPLVIVSSAVPETNPELGEARRAGLPIAHRSDLLAALIEAQPSIAVAGSHGKTTTSSLIATLLEAVGEDPTAVIGGVVPAFGSNGRQGRGRLLVAEADESDGSLVKFRAHLGVITNIELDHTDHYPDLEALIRTLGQFAAASERLLANRDCPNLRDHFQPDAWWSTTDPAGSDYTCVLYTSPSPRDATLSRMPSSA